MNRRLVYILVTAVILSLLLLRFLDYGGKEPPAGLYTVIRVVDGDTVELENRGTVRLLFIDTPERGEMYYDSAKIFLRETILGRQVSIVPGSRARDAYGRLLAFVYLDTVFINLELVERGFAGLYLFPENMGDTARVNQFLAAQQTSISDNRGIWSLPYVEEPYYIGNARSLRFHRPACNSSERMNPGNKIRFDSREDALSRGFAPCRNCKP